MVCFARDIVAIRSSIGCLKPLRTDRLNSGASSRNKTLLRLRGILVAATNCLKDCNHEENHSMDGTPEEI